MQPVQPEPVPVIALVRHRQPPHRAGAHVHMHAAHLHGGHVPVITVHHSGIAAHLSRVAVAHLAVVPAVTIHMGVVPVDHLAAVHLVMVSAAARRLVGLAAVAQQAAARADRGQRPLGIPVGESHPGLLQGPWNLGGTGGRRLGTRCGHGLPGTRHRCGHRGDRDPADQEDVGVRGRHGLRPAPAAQVIFGGQADGGGTWHGDGQHVRPGRPGPQQHPGQVHRSAPSRHA
jgi:hypothetical protein